MKTTLILLSICCGLSAQELKVTVSNWNSTNLAQFAGRFPAFRPTVQVLIEDNAPAGARYVVDLESPVGRRSLSCARSFGAATMCVLDEDLPDPVTATVRTESGTLSRVSDAIPAARVSISAYVVNRNAALLAQQGRFIPFIAELPPHVQVWFRDSGDAATGYLVTLLANGEERSMYVPRSSAADGQLFTSFQIDAERVKVNIEPVVAGLVMEE